MKRVRCILKKQERQAHMNMIKSIIDFNEKKEFIQWLHDEKKY